MTFVYSQSFRTTIIATTGDFFVLYTLKIQRSPLNTHLPSICGSSNLNLLRLSVGEFLGEGRGDDRGDERGDRGLSLGGEDTSK